MPNQFWESQSLEIRISESIVVRDKLILISRRQNIPSFHLSVAPSYRLLVEVDFFNKALTSRVPFDILRSSKIGPSERPVGSVVISKQ